VGQLYHGTRSHGPPFRTVTTFLVVTTTDVSQAWALLESEGFEVVGEAVDGASAIEAAASLKPDVVLLDVYLRDMEGFEVEGGCA
jgi:chemotaxis response regulator CheB